MSEQDVAGATDAGMTAATERYGHYEAKTHGQAATCGDPMPAEPALQSHTSATGQNPQATVNAHSTV